MGIGEVASGEESVTDRTVQGGRLLTGVGHHQDPIPVSICAAASGENSVGGEGGEGVAAFGLRGVDADLVTTIQCVPDLSDPLTVRLTIRLAPEGT